MSQTLAYVDVTQLGEDLTAIAGGSVEANTKVLVASTLAQVELLAYNYAPVNTGALRGGISSYPINNGMGGVVQSTALYSSYVELGTGVRGEFPGHPIIIRPRGGGYLRFVAKNGRVIYTKQVISPGMAPRPFLRPALERVITPLAEGLASSAVISVVKGPKAPETLLNAPATGWH